MYFIRTHDQIIQVMQRVWQVKYVIAGFNELHIGGLGRGKGGEVKDIGGGEREAWGGGRGKGGGRGDKEGGEGVR